MFSHVTVGTQDLERAGRFYDAVLAPLGLRQRVVTPDDGPPALCWVSGVTPLPRFYVYMPRDGLPATVGNGSMAAFLAPTAEAVKASWASGLANGGTDEGAPDERPHYGKGYFGAYLRDPDGNKIHVVYRGDLHPHAERPLL
ncbi:VOC family protein [Pseudomonas sp. FME51]|uniref:VOC family protein n=1 Tax=Pseudomonas sp. FME51 TaxID=2742609 RepID=UPI0018687029|nr:VOC family protein [Pseudomonas sp. FME51]